MTIITLIIGIAAWLAISVAFEKIVDMRRDIRQLNKRLIDLESRMEEVNPKYREMED